SQAIRRRDGGVEADQLPPRRLQRRLDTVEAVDPGDVRVAPLGGPVAPAPEFMGGGGARRLWPLRAPPFGSGRRRCVPAVALAGHRSPLAAHRRSDALG